MKQKTKKTPMLAWCCALFLVCTWMSQAQAQTGGDIRTRTVTIGFTNEPLEQALIAVGRASGFQLALSSELVDATKTVTLPRAERSVEATLNLLLQGTNLAFDVRGNRITFSERSATPASTPPNNENQQVTGRVVDDATGETLPFVTVMVKGTTTGTVTSTDGSFTIGVPSTESVLQFSFLGYESLELRATAGRTMAVRLRTSAAELEGVVITGYQTLSRERVTGSYSIITSEKLGSKLQPSVKSVLEGLASGVVLTKEGDIEIRGVSTLNTSRQPLIVLDGYPLVGEGLDLDFINPENIESITVLKDAVAASIYGARSANGVIVITTKRGPAGRFTANYKGTFGAILKPDLNKLHMASPADFMDVELEMYNLNRTNYLNSHNNFNRISDYTYLLMLQDQPTLRESLGLTTGDIDARIAALRNNNALKDIEQHLMQPKLSQQHNFSVSSSTDMNQFSAMLRFVKENDHLITTGNNRMTFDINNTWKPQKWVTVRILSNFNYTNSDNPTDRYIQLTNFNVGTGSGTPTAVKIMPYTQLYDANGNPTPYSAVGQNRVATYLTTPGMKSWLYHPEEDLKQSRATANNLQARLGGDMTLRFFDFLTGSIGGTWTRGASTNRTIWDRESFNMRTAYNDGTSRTNPQQYRHIPDGGKIDENRGTMESWLIRGQLNYNQSFNNEKHRLNAILVTEAMKETFERAFMPTRFGYNPAFGTFYTGMDLIGLMTSVIAPHPYDSVNFPSGVVNNMLFSRNPANIGLYSAGAAYTLLDRRRASWLANGSYEYNNRYILSGSIRWELSNYYGTDPQYRYKPTWSVGGAWKIAEEDFFADYRHLFDRVNLRSTFGVLGSDVANYTPYTILGPINNFYQVQWGGHMFQILSYPNSQLRYEKKRTFDMGLDVTMFKNKIDIGLNYYRNRSYDLIALDVIDPTRGISQINQNAGQLTNTGLEVDLTAHLVRNRGFNWSSNLIVSYNTSNVDKNNIRRQFWGDFVRQTPVMIEDYPADALWGFRFAGLSTTGLAQYYKNDSAQTIVQAGGLGVEDVVYLGTVRAPLNMSWTNRFRYKGWEASFMFIAQMGGIYRADCFHGNNIINRHVGQRWREAGDEDKTIFPKLYGSFGAQVYPFIQEFAKSSNYLKLRDFTLAYNLPREWTNRIGIAGTKIHFQTRNLFYITAKGVDIDPETARIPTENVSSDMTQSGFTVLQLRPEFYVGLTVNF